MYILQSDVQDSSMKVSRVDATMKNSLVTITNPVNNIVYVHYVETDGTSAGVGDYNIINLGFSERTLLYIPGYTLSIKPA